MSKKRSCKKHESKRKPSQGEIDDALAALIASTRRKTRRLDPLAVAEKIRVAREGLGSISRVAERIGLSEEMVRQIFSVQKCAEQVKKLVREGKLNSFDVLHRLSKLPASEQLPVARAVVAGELNSEDVRAIVTFRREISGSNIRNVIDRIKSTRNVRQYIAYFKLAKRRAGKKGLRSRFEGALGKGNVISVEITGETGMLLLNNKGKKRLQEGAKGRGVTKRMFIEHLIAGRIE